jgi:hypothetical protein
MVTAWPVAENDPAITITTEGRRTSGERAPSGGKRPGLKRKAPQRSGGILLRLSRPNVEPGAADEIHCLCDLTLSLLGER